MAEAIGTIASVLTILELVKKVKEFVDDFKGAKNQQEELRRVLAVFQTKIDLLGQLEKRAEENPKDDRFKAFRAILKSSTFDSHSKKLGLDLGHRSVGALQRIQNNMISILEKLESLKQNSVESKLKRLWWSYDKTKFHRIIRKIDESIKQVESVLTYDGHFILIDTNDGIRKMNDDMTRVRRNQEVDAEDRQRVAREREQEAKEKKRVAIIEWLSPLRFRERQSQLYNQCLQQNVSTSSFLESPEFDAWRSGSPWRLQCFGEPGSGKTLLCALVVERLRTFFSDQNIPILCIYLNYKESHIQTLDNLISSLLKQLLQHPNAEFKSPEAKRLFSGAENESRPTLAEFYEAFHAETQFFERVMILVDAYDEASSAVQSRLLDKLVNLPTEKVGLLITSRPIEDRYDQWEVPKRCCDSCGRGRGTDDNPSPPLDSHYHCEKCHFDLCPSCGAKNPYCNDRTHTIEVPDEVRMSIEPSEDEIKLYVEKELESEFQLGRSNYGNNTFTKSSIGTTPLGRICRKRADLKARIVPTVVEKANSMFTLAGLYMQTLRSCISEGEIEDALDHPPDGYSGFYERNMKRIIEEPENIRASNLARKVLEWVVHANRPLSLAELQDALAVNLNETKLRKAARPDKATVLEVTAGMIMIDDDEKNVRLNHRTAQEYFNETRERWFASAFADIARVSLQYLSFEELSKPCEGIYEDKDFDARKKAYPLLEYACIYWGDHACETGPHSETQAAVLKYVSDFDKITAWTQAAWYLRSTERAEWDIRKGAKALHVCAWFGLTDVVSTLLDEGLDVNAVDPRYKQTPLMYACRRGHRATVAKLLESGADVNHYSERQSVALFEAVDNGLVEIVELLLLRTELDVNAMHLERNNRTALMLAALDGKLQVVQALLSRSGILLDKKDFDGYTALSLASINGQSEVVEAILEHDGIGIDSQNEVGRTALTLAAGATGGLAEAIQIAKDLLNHGANTSIKDREGGGTAILRAVDEGNEAMVRLLLDYDADINVRDELNRGLLHSAAIGGHEAIVQLLINKGLDINAQDQNGKTPLHDAGRNGDPKVAKLLLESHADPSIKDRHRRTPWIVAWQYGHLNVMRTLESKDITEQTIQQDCYPELHSLPIWSIAKLGFEQQVKNMIATKPKEIYFCDPDMSNTAIHCAVDAKNLNILTLLLNAGLSPDSVNDYHRTPLHLAALTGHTNLVLILLAHNAKCDGKDRWLQTPLGIAHNNRHLDCAVLLVEAGAIPSPNMIQRLFFASVELGRLAAVTKLIDLGADLSVKNVLGQTALQIAKEAGRDEVVQVLRTNKSVFRSPRVGSNITEVEEQEEAAEEEKMAMLSVKESPFYKPEVWTEEESEDERTVVAGGRGSSVVQAKASERRVRVLEPAV